MKRNLIERFLFYTVLALGVIIYPCKVFAAEYEVDGGLYSIESNIDATVTFMGVSESFTGSTFVVPEEVVLRDPKFQGYGPFRVISITSFGKKNQTVRTVVIPETVTSIQWNTNSLPPNLSEFVVSEGNPKYASRDGVIYDKGYKELMFCPSHLEGKLIVPEGVTTIGKEAFMNSQISGIELPSTLVRIEDRAFNKCNLNQITIPGSVTYIGEGCFSNCENLHEITIPGSVTYLGAYAFFDCKNLRSATLPNSIDTIRRDTFLGTSLSTFDVPSSVTTIEGLAFSTRTLRSITIPAETVDIDPLAFNGCNSLNDIQISPDNPNYSSNGRALMNKDRTILYSTDSGSIPDGIEEVKRFVFRDATSITYIGFPKSVVKIDNSATADCYFLKSVTFMSLDPPQVGTSNFDDPKGGYKLDIKMYVPGPSLELYKKDPFLRIWANNMYAIPGTDAVEEIAIDPVQPNFYTVYTTDGRLVLETSNAERLNALPKGIYIINGKKVVK